MKLTPRNVLTLAAALLILAGLAYFMSDLVRDLIIIPLLYFWWVLGLVYRAIPQQVYWVLLVVLLVYIYAASFIGRIRIRTREESLKISMRGPVESLSIWIDDSHKGIYFKWRIARLLADVADYILTVQDRRLPGKKLAGKDWTPPRSVAEYLDAGLNSTFADYPAPGFLAPRPKTPFDVDIEPVVAYLESELEIRDDHYKPS